MSLRSKSLKEKIYHVDVADLEGWEKNWTYVLEHPPSENCITSYFTILKNYFINYTIPFYNILSNLKHFFSPFYLNILFYSFFFIISLFLFLFLSFSLNLQHQSQQIKKKKSIATQPPPCHHQRTVTPTYASATHRTIKPKPKSH